LNIIFYDVLQESDAPKELLSPSLADTYTTPEYLEITLNNPAVINSIGIGYTDTETFNIELTDSNNMVFSFIVNFSENGLYLLDKTVENIKEIKFTFTGSYVGRIGLGKAVNLKTSIPKEPTLVSTNKPRITLSGQVIEGLGGYNYRRINLDTRYKIGEEELEEIIKGFPVLSKGHPLFVSFEDEQNRIPFKRMYCNDKNQQQISFESSINKYLFSRKFVFEERF
jgi:hypothetical protein